MKLILTHPSAWPVYRLDDGPADATGSASILVGPVEVTASKWGPWMERVIGFERPPFTIAEIVRTSPIHSALRWKVEMVESRLSAGAEVIERRLSYLYFMLEWCAAVVFRTSPTSFEAEVDRAVPVLSSGRPSWDGGVVALADLYR